MTVNLDQLNLRFEQYKKTADEIVGRFGLVIDNTTQLDERDQLYQWKNKQGNAILISSSGGGGHKSASAAKQQILKRSLLRLMDKNIGEMIHFVRCLQGNHDCMDTDAGEIDQYLRESYANDILTMAREYAARVSTILEQLDGQPLSMEYDMLGEWMPFGLYGVNVVNEAQKRGDIKTMDSWSTPSSGTTIHEYLFYPILFFRALISLLWHNADHLIMTQPSGLLPICHAVRFVNFIRRYDIADNKRPALRIDLCMTEMPTDKAQNYFHNLRSLGETDKSLIRLETLPPLTVKDETETDFWQKQLGEHHYEGENGHGIQICYNDPPLRQTFYSSDKLSRDAIHEQGFDIKLNSHEDEKPYAKLVAAGLVKRSNDQLVNLSIRPNDRLMTLMLGSNGSAQVIEYVNHAIDMARDNLADHNGNLFFTVFCGRRLPSEQDMYTQIMNCLDERQEEIPPNLHIIPLGFQDDTLIAPLLARTDVDIRRAGGLSTMEGYHVFSRINPHARVMIHTDADREQIAHTPGEEKSAELLKGLVTHEIGNAKYLMNTVNATVTNPDEFKRSQQAFMPLSLPTPSVGPESAWDYSYDDETLSTVLSCDESFDGGDLQNKTDYLHAAEFHSMKPYRMGHSLLFSDGMIQSAVDEYVTSTIDDKLSTNKYSIEDELDRLTVLQERLTQYCR